MMMYTQLGTLYDWVMKDNLGETQDCASASAIILNWENESLPIAAQNNIIRTDYVKAKTDFTQQKSKCRLCVEKKWTD